MQQDPFLQKKPVVKFEFSRCKEALNIPIIIFPFLRHIVLPLKGTKTRRTRRVLHFYLPYIYVQLTLLAGCSKWLSLIHI